MTDNDGVFRATGAELLQEAITDWEIFSTDETFAAWFPEVAWIKADGLYKFGSGLDGIEEVEVNHE